MGKARPVTLADCAKQHRGLVDALEKTPLPHFAIRPSFIQTLRQCQALMKGVNRGVRG